MSNVRFETSDLEHKLETLTNELELVKADLRRRAKESNFTLETLLEDIANCEMGSGAHFAFDIPGFENVAFTICPEAYECGEHILDCADREVVAVQAIEGRKGLMYLPLETPVILI